MKDKNQNHIVQKFRKNPIVVEAVQFTEENKDMVYNWAKSIQANVFHDWDENKEPILKIPTLEGEMICSIGDYIIVEPFPTDWRKLYPCKKSIFEQTYETNQIGEPNKKVSSVEWLYNKMYEHRGNITIEEFQQAKAMHKEEIIKSWMATDNELQRISAEQYYNETYNK